MLPGSIITGELFTGKYSYAWVYYIGNTLSGLVCGLLWRWVYVGSCGTKENTWEFCADEETHEEHVKKQEEMKDLIGKMANLIKKGAAEGDKDKDNEGGKPEGDNQDEEQGNLINKGQDGDKDNSG